MASAHGQSSLRFSQTPPEVRQINISLWQNSENETWSVVIDNQRHSNLSAAALESLVECAVITAEMSLQGDLPPDQERHPRPVIFH
jgi:hypothetical protein